MCFAFKVLKKKMFVTLNLKFYAHSSINYKDQAKTLSHTINP